MAECSDGSVIFRFADAQDLKKQGEGLLDFREEDRGIRGKMEGEVERFDLAGESEVVEQDLGIESERLESDAVSEKPVGLESDKLEETEGSHGGCNFKIEDGEFREKRIDLEVESEIVQNTSGSVEVCGKDESVNKKGLDSESELEEMRVCVENESSALDAQRQLLEETLDGDQEENVINVKTMSVCLEKDNVSNVEMESPETAKGGQEIKVIALQSDESLEEEKVSDVETELKGESNDGVLLVEEESAISEDDNPQIAISEMSEELLDDALVSKERFGDDTEASEVSMTSIAVQDMEAESTSVPVEDGGASDTAETPVLVISFFFLTTKMFK